MAADAAHAAAGLGHGAEEAAFELLDVVFLWILPIITLIVGYAMSGAIGLSGAIGTLIDGALGASGSVSQTVMCYIADFAAILIWVSIGAAMWSVATRKNIKDGYAAYILRPLATLFFGFGVGEVPALMAGKVNNGSLGQAAMTLASKT